MNKKISKTVISIILTIITFITFIPTNVLAATSFSNADLISLNESYVGTLATEDDVNYYKFTTTGNDSLYKIELRNTEATDTVGLYLYSGDDVTTNVYYLRADVASVDNDVRKLEPNHTYYIAVKNPYKYIGSPTGNYKLSVTEIKDDVPDDFKNSKSIPINKKVAYTIDAVGDSDYFKFTTTGNNSFYKIELANSEGTDVLGAFLYSADDSTTKINEVTAYKASLDSITSKLEPKHTYYLIVKNPYENFYDTTGTYKLSIREIKDDAPDSFKKSIKLTLNKKSNFKLNVDGDIDYFKFKTSKKGAYTITLANGCDNDLSATIFKENDITQKIDIISAYKASKSFKTYKLKANHTYYIAVAKKYNFYSVTGKYSLTVKMK